MRIRIRLARGARVQATFQRRQIRRYVSVGTLRHKGRPGVNTVRFTGRLKGRRLRRGQYRLVVRAIEANGKVLGRRIITLRVV
jgi:hypothetical protein